MPPTTAGLQLVPKGIAVNTYASKGGDPATVESFPKKWRLRIPWYIFGAALAAPANPTRAATLPIATAKKFLNVLLPLPWTSGAPR
jgi:hypothetical protein